MSHLLLLTNSNEPPDHVLPALGLLLHSVRVSPAEAGALLAPGMDQPASAPVNAILVDARKDLTAARNFCRLLDTTGLDCPLIAILTEGGVAALSPDWRVDDFVLSSAGPAEIEARLRLAIGHAEAGIDDPDEIRHGDLVIDEATYIARLRGRILDLTFKEFELLKFLAQHPGRVCTRTQLLQEVWGYDYFGGTRTIDVHVRRLRAKLGAEYKSLIGTVRNVGYRFAPDPSARSVSGDSAMAWDFNKLTGTTSSGEPGG